MKKTTIIFYFIIWSFSCFGQATSVWMPVEPNHSFEDNEIVESNFLLLFEAFEFHNDTLLVLLRHGEISPILYEKMTEDSITVFKLIGVENFINLNYFRYELIEKIEKTQFYFIIDKHSLFLCTRNGYSIKTMEFLDVLNKYKYRNILEAKIKLNGKLNWWIGDSN